MLGCRHSTSESKYVYVDKLISIDDIRSTPNLTLCLKKSEVLLPEVQDICKLNLVSVFRVRKFRKPLVPQSRVWTCSWGARIWPGRPRPRPCRVSCLPWTPRRRSVRLRTPPSRRSRRSLGGIPDSLDRDLKYISFFFCSGLIDWFKQNSLLKFWNINNKYSNGNRRLQVKTMTEQQNGWSETKQRWSR